MSTDPAAVMAAWDDGQETFTATQERFVGYRSALKLGVETWRTWQRQDRKISFTLFPRRIELRRKDGILYTRPPDTAQPFLLDYFQDDFVDSVRLENTLAQEQPDIGTLDEDDTANG